MSLPAFDLSAPPVPLALMFQDQPLAGEQQGGEAPQGVSLDPGAPTGQPAGQPPPGWLVTLYNVMPLILIGLLFYFLIVGGGRKRERQRQEMISGLSRGDRITTIGGIIGNVVDATGDEIVLKVDENNNTKIRITRSAVASVARQEAGKK